MKPGDLVFIAADYFDPSVDTINNNNKKKEKTKVRKEKRSSLFDIPSALHRGKNKQRKAQIHNMVHVEIWMGDGEKTLGARAQRGVVQVHDSYRFVSQNYGNMRFFFKSIDTWLQGICHRHAGQTEGRAGGRR